MKRMNVVLFSAVSVLFAGCSVLSPIVGEQEKNFKNADGKVQSVLEGMTEEGRVAGLPGTVAYAAQRAQEQVNPTLVRKTQGKWVGAMMVPITEEDKLPAFFDEKHVLSFGKDGTTVDINKLASQLSVITGIPFRVQDDVMKEAAGARGRPTGSASGVVELPAIGAPGLQPINVEGVTNLRPISWQNIQVDWNGRLRDFLNHITDRLGLSWEYRDGTVVIMKYTTAFYELAAFRAKQNYTMKAGNSSSAGGQESQSNTSVTVDETGESDFYEDVIKSIKSIVKAAEGSEVIETGGSGRIMVKTTKDLQSAVRDFVRTENKSMTRQVQVQLDIYSVQTEQTTQFGVDWDVFLSSVNRRLQGTLSGPQSILEAGAGLITARSISSVPSANARQTATTIISSLNDIGHSVQYRPVSLIAMNRQWARKSRLSQISYLAETRPATGGVLGGTAGVPGLSTEEITTGDQYAAMPYILDNNKVMLKLGLSLSDLVRLGVISTGEGPTLQQVQTPEVTSVNDQYTVILNPGEMVAVTGLSREVEQDDTRTLGERIPLFAGGSMRRGRNIEHFVVFIRAVVM